MAAYEPPPDHVRSDIDVYCPAAEFARLCSLRGSDQMTALYRRGVEMTAERITLFFVTLGSDPVMLCVSLALHLPARVFDLVGTWRVNVDQQRHCVTIFVDGDLLCQKVGQTAGHWPPQRRKPRRQ